MSEELKAIERAILECQNIANQLKSNSASFRSRVLLEMLLLELGRDLARLATQRNREA